MKSSIIGGRLTVATFILMLSASMVGLSLSIKNSKKQEGYINADSHLQTEGNEDYSNKKQDTYGCDCMLRTVSISFRNFGLLADLDQVMLPPHSKSNLRPVGTGNQENVRNKKRKFFQGTCPDKFMSVNDRYPSVSSAAQGEVSRNDVNKTLSTSNISPSTDKKINSKPTQLQHDPWSVNIGRCLGICTSSPGMPMKARVTNKSLYNLYDLVGANETSRTNANVSKVQTTSNYPAMNDEIVSGDSLNSANQILQLDPDFGCLPTLSKRKKISIRIPWNKTPRDHTPSRRKAKSNISPSNSESSDANAQKRSSKKRNDNNNVNDISQNIEEALTIFSEVEEHLSCSCQDLNNRQNKFFNSEHNFDEGNTKSVKGEKISSKPSKGRTRRSALSMGNEQLDGRNKNGRHKDSFQLNVDEEGNILNYKDASSRDWINDFEDSSSYKNSLLDKSNTIFEKYTSDRDDDSGRTNIFAGTNEKSALSSPYSKKEYSLRDKTDVIDVNRTNSEDDSVAIYYDTCLACKQQQDTCEESIIKKPFYFQRLCIYFENLNIVDKV